MRWLLLFTLCIAFNMVRSQQAKNDSVLLQYKAAVALYNYANDFANNKDYSEKKEIELNKRLLDKIRVIYSKITSKPSYDTIRFHACYMIAELEHYFEHHSAAYTYYQRAINHSLQSRLPDSLMFRPHIYSGIILYNEGKIDLAAEQFHKAEAIQQKYSKPLQENQRLYNTLGVLNFETGNYKQAKNYFLQSLDRLSPSNVYYSDLLVNYKVNLAHMHFKLEEYNEALKIYSELLHQNKNINDIYHNIGLIHLAQSKPAEALSFFKKASYADHKRIRLYNNIGRAYLNLQQYDSAQHYLKAALSFDQNLDQTGHGLALKTLADLQMSLGKAKPALQYYTSALQVFYPGFRSSATTDVPGSYSGYLSYINLYEVLLGKAEAAHLLFSQTNEIKWGIDELRSYQSAFKLIEHVEQTYNSDEARLFINRIKYRAHSKPIDIAYELYKRTNDRTYLEALYNFDQQNKASVLALNQSLPGNASSGSISLQQKERKLRTAITHLSLKAAEINNEAAIIPINKVIRSYETELANLHNNSKLNAAFAKKIPPLNILKDNFLDGRTAILSYHLGENSITIIIITSKDVTCFQKPIPTNFKLIINDYIEQLHDPLRDGDPGIGKRLYQLLLSPIDQLDVNRLILIPDDELIYLPFESLQDENKHFVIEKYSIQYQYSTVILGKEDQNYAGKPVLSFAPFVASIPFGQEASFNKLPYSLEEINNLKGKRFIGDEASRKAFFDHVGNFKIVHLATHAVAGNGTGRSFIAFRGNNGIELLHTEEIYNLALSNTKLMILSACETGTGDLVRGEGVMSISRSFTYAGCSNIITTLWKTNDFSTAYLTKRIHKYIDKNYSIDMAVQQAKIDYLSDPFVNPRLKHPYYWSHLVFIGNYQKSQGNNKLIFIIGSIILILTGGAYYFIKFRKKSDH